MKKITRFSMYLQIVFAALLLAGWSNAARAASLCAEVQMEVLQSATLERQAFDAMMRIHNGYDQNTLSNVTISVRIVNTLGQEQTITSNAQNTNALFFVRPDSLSEITAVSNGVVYARRSAEIHWLIIPAPGAGGTNALGLTYGISAQLDYKVAGQSYSVRVNPEWITVRPMPKLTLNYYLPDQVYGDDPWTEPIEESIPFSFGLRVVNSGAGDAYHLAIESAQPQIVENRLGLLVGFEILSCSVQGGAQGRTLRASFETLPAAGVRVARWQMTASLLGRFTNVTAAFTHADDLGGQLTSLIETSTVFSLVKDVVVDLEGRDGVRDFLIHAGAGVAVHESDRQATLAVTDSSAQSALMALHATEGSYFYRLTVPTNRQPFYVKVPFPEAADKTVAQVVRKDGKMVNAANAWISQQRENGDHPWEYAFNLFDVNGGGEYSVIFNRKPVLENVAPLLAYIGNKVTWEGEEIGFLVQASDPNLTVPTLSATGLPGGATFVNAGTGTGTFLWQTQVGDYGVHLVKFMATDGQYTVSKIGRIYVGHPGEPLAANGLPESLADWKPTIKELGAMSGSPAAELRWESTEGVPYEVYWSDQAFGQNMAWTRSGGVLSAGPETEALDSTLGQERMRRFYQVVVEGDAPDQRQVWGVVRRDVKAASFTMISPPVQMDRRFDGELGTALAEELQGRDGGIGMGADEVYVLQAGGAWRTLYLDASGIWHEANGTASTYELPAGQGFWVARKAGAPARITFTGPVGNNGTGRQALQPGFNLIGLSEGKDLPLQATLSSANPQGGSVEEMADQLVFQNPNGSWRRLMYVQGWGAPFDGNWFDLGTFQIVPTNAVLEPGAAYYYYRQPAAGATSVGF